MNDPDKRASQDAESPVSSATGMFAGRVEGQAASLPPANAKSTPDAAGGKNQPAGGPPGEFTQMFQALVPGADTAATGPAKGPEAARQPTGDFTRIFVQIPTPPVAPGPASAPLRPTEAQAASGPGEFTQAMKPPEITRAPLETSPPEAPGSGGFTQMFQRASAESPSKDDAAGSAHSDLSAEYGQIFRPSGNRGPSRPFDVEKPFAFDSRNAAPQPQSAGNQPGITRLMQALSETGPSADATPAAQAGSYGFAPMQAGSSDLTALEQRLSDVPLVAQEAPAARNEGPAAAAGPGEFTRIISGAMLREASASMESKAAPPIPQSELKLPAVPAAKISAPPAPAPPALPAARMPAPAQSKLQQYLPLLLILNAFLLLVLIVLVIFAVRSH